MAEGCHIPEEIRNSHPQKSKTSTCTFSAWTGRELCTHSSWSLFPVILWKTDQDVFIWGCEVVVSIVCVLVLLRNPYPANPRLMKLGAPDREVKVSYER